MTGGRMSISVQPPRGMRQLYPDELGVERYITNAMLAAGRAYGYEEYEAPLLESLELFLAKSGNELAREQSYNFVDKGGRELVLRPELTPSLARMIAARASELPKPIRWMSMPVCYRYEKPQRGRVREFVQFNCDILGCDALDAELEMMLLLGRIMRTLGARPGQFEVRYSSRRLAGEVLVSAGFEPSGLQVAFSIMDKRAKMPRDRWARFLETEIADRERSAAVSRFLECEDPDDPWLRSAVGNPEALEEVRRLDAMLRESGLEEAVFDASVVRGLDYYTGIVFELMDTGGSNRRAICGGGRYDDLIGIFGSRQMSGVGFGLGVLSLRLFLEIYGLLPDSGGGGVSQPLADVFTIAVTEEESSLAVSVSEKLRDSGLSVLMGTSSRSVSRQLGAANRAGARWAMIVGPEEREGSSVTLRNMATGHQSSLAVDDLPGPLIND